MLTARTELEGPVVDWGGVPARMMYEAPSDTPAHLCPRLPRNHNCRPIATVRAPHPSFSDGLYQNVRLI